jgi:hypothetical protein
MFKKLLVAGDLTEREDSPSLNNHHSHEFLSVFALHRKAKPVIRFAPAGQ